VSYFGGNYFGGEYYGGQYWGIGSKLRISRKYFIHFLAKDAISLTEKENIVLGSRNDISFDSIERNIHFNSKPNLLVMPKMDANLNHRRGIEIIRNKDIIQKERESIALDSQNISVSKPSEIEVKE